MQPFVCVSVDGVGAVCLHDDVAGVQLSERADHMIDVGAAGRLIAGMHGQLRKANIHGVHRGVRVGDVAQRGAAENIGAVGEVLHRHAGLGADGGEDRTGNGVGGVLLVGVMLDAFRLCKALSLIKISRRIYTCHSLNYELC